MKRINILFIVFSMFVILACTDDFLEIAPEDKIVVDNFYNTAEELRMSTAALYNIPWFDFNDKSNFAIGDGAGGNFATNDGAFTAFSVFGTQSTSPRLNEAWRSLYLVVSHSNNIINAINERASESIPEADRNLALAEARFMRGYAYSYLALLWGHVPIIENNVDMLEDPVVPRNKLSDVFQFVINDFEYAAEHLLEEDVAGRVTQWSAKGMLARIHLYRAGVNQSGGNRNQEDLDKAKAYAEDVIKNSGLSLMENYADLYKLENNNNPESLFALQWVDNQTNWGAQNTHQAYFAAEGKLTGVGDGWGGANGGTPDMLSLYEDGDQRRKATFMLKGDHYPELLQAEGGYMYDKESYAGSAVKKYVIGTPEDNNGAVAFMSTSINTYMLRLAEVYLIYAEAILGNSESTTDSEALQYFNMVRNRAGLDDDADGTLTFVEILEEKRLELAMEGQTWYDLVRWHYFDPSAAIDYISNQNRGHFEWENGEKSPVDLFVTPTNEDFNFEYPETDVINNPLLQQEPVDYDFSE